MRVWAPSADHRGRRGQNQQTKTQRSTSARAEVNVSLQPGLGGALRPGLTFKRGYLRVAVAETSGEMSEDPLPLLRFSHQRKRLQEVPVT